MSVDALIITALQDELDALRGVATGALGSAWNRKTDSSGYEYHIREFARDGGGKLRIAAARAVSAGAGHAGAVATRLVKELRPRCLAMCGICAGRRGEVSLGDVIVADRVFRYDAGKLKAFRNAAGQRVEEVLFDLTTYQLDPRWQLAFDDFAKSWLPTWTAPRPLSLDRQVTWLLDSLYRAESNGGPGPLDDPQRNHDCPDWRRVLERAQLRGFLRRYPKELALSERGRKLITRLRLEHPDTLPAVPGLAIRLGPLGTGEKVVVDSEIFSALEKVERKLLGLEMEAQAIGLVAELERVNFMIVVKGVQDFADPDKDDSFRGYAARAAAEFLLAFLRQYLECEPAATSPGEAPQRPASKPSVGGPQAGGRFNLDFYVPRPHEEGEVFSRFSSAKPAVLWGPARFGKTWLMKVVYRRFAELNPEARRVMLSADHLEPEAQRSLDGFLRWLAERIVSETGGNPQWIDEVWSNRYSGPKQKLNRLMTQHVLASPAPLLLGFDRADDLLRHDFAADFFKLLRSWADDEVEPWPRLRLLLAVAMRPNLLVDDPNNSPFNLSERIELLDFDDRQIAELAIFYGLHTDVAERASLRRLIGGNPFLAGLAFEKMAAQPGRSLSEILSTDEKQLFGDYLDRLRKNLRGHPKLSETLACLHRQPTVVVDPNLLYELERSGLIEIELEGDGLRWRMRCELYKRLVPAFEA